MATDWETETGFIPTPICVALKMSGERTLQILRNRSYGQNKLSNPNLKNIKKIKIQEYL